VAINGVTQRGGGMFGIVFTMLPDTRDVEMVLFGNQGIVEGLQSRKDSICIVIPISPIETQKFVKNKILG
jgi:2-hydroxy-3-oxopropionate reductase